MRETAKGAGVTTSAKMSCLEPIRLMPLFGYTQQIHRETCLLAMLFPNLFPGPRRGPKSYDGAEFEQRIEDRGFDVKPAKQNIKWLRVSLLFG